MLTRARSISPTNTAFQEQSFSSNRRIAFSSEPYSEELQTSTTLREHYTLFNQACKFDVTQPPRDLSKRLQDYPFGDDVRINAVPLVLPQSELKLIQSASNQIAKALTHFIDDIFLGHGKILDSASGIPTWLVDVMLCSNAQAPLSELRTKWKDRSAEDIMFLMGMDIVKDPAGNFKIIEINVGNIGGLPDIYHVPQKYLQLSGLTSQSINGFATQEVPSHFFLDALRINLGIESENIVAIGRNRNDSKIRELLSQGTNTDLEDIRWTDNLSSQGVRCVAAHEVSDATYSNARVILNRALTKYEDQAWDEGKALLNPPGVAEILSSKLLLPYLHKIIWFYMRENPLIETPQSSVIRVHRHEKTGETNLMNLDGKTFKFPTEKGLVFKTANGSSGIEITIVKPGASFSAKHLNLGNQLCAAAIWSNRTDSLILAQDFIPISTLAGSRIDLRPITYALGNYESITSDFPWGRAQKIGNNPHSVTNASLKTNVFQCASVLPIFAAL